ncbi:hypothetical protein QL093DRAFT_2591180 [Fusarium oxysporum]|nr:hypothetical protein QL093DRAFT_2591180 [Fusarium oxysporum]
MSYEQVANSLPGETIEIHPIVEHASGTVEPDLLAGKTSIPPDWHQGPRTLRPGVLESVASWSWDILLTLIPACFVGENVPSELYMFDYFFVAYLFLALAIAALRLDNKPTSNNPTGEKVFNLTLLSPTIFPIVFAAITSRFFKNLARWRLEKQQGIKLATLEQIFGSQNFAGAVERFVVVRTQFFVGIIIILTWGLSPIGGQSAARLLTKGRISVRAPGLISYVHPGYQSSWFYDSDERKLRSTAAVDALYTTGLLASPEQKVSPLDVWNLPKIPRWPKNVESHEDRMIDPDSFAKGTETYSSLLGVQIMGLDFVNKEVLYDFTVETSYYDIDCEKPKIGLFINQSYDYFPDPSFGQDPDFDRSNFNLSAIKPIPPNDLPPSYIQYAALNSKHEFDLFNCIIRPVIVETGILCNSSSSGAMTCRATSQRRVTNINHTLNGLWFDALKSPTKDIISTSLRLAGAKLDIFTLSPTDNYMAGEQYPFSPRLGQDWTQVDIKSFSGRLTTVFNTYWEASLDPFYHTFVDYRSQPPEQYPAHGNLESDNQPPIFNRTEAVVTTLNHVYIVNHGWVTVLMAITLCLEILAVGGLILRGFIQGPDILGFASSLTRENAYMNLPRGGSALDGPKRARSLGNVRVCLADVNPRDEVGYIAFMAVPSPTRSRSTETDSKWLKINSKRQYF